MKKFLIPLISLTLVLVLLSSCRKTPQELSIDTAKHFIEKLYETPAEDLSFLAHKIIAPEELIDLVNGYLDTYRDFFTEEGFNSAVANRIFLFNSQYLLETQNIITVDNITFTKIYKDKKVLTDLDMIFTNIDVSYHVTKKNGDTKNFKDSISINLLQENDKWRIDHVNLNIFFSMRHEIWDARNIKESKRIIKDMFKTLYTQTPEDLCYFLNHPMPDEKYESIPNAEAVKRQNELFKPLLDLQSKDYHGFHPLSEYYYHCIDNNLNLDFVNLNFSWSDIDSTSDDKKIYSLECSVEYKTTSNDTSIESLYVDDYKVNMIQEKDSLKILYLKSDKKSLK